MEAAALGLRVDGVKGIDDASKSLDRLSGSAESAEQASGGLSTESRKTTKSLADVSREGSGASRSFSLLANAAKLAAAAVGGLTFRRVITESADFEDAMLGLQAVSSATADQMARLQEQARTLGATSMFSAKQAGDAQRFLAQAGFEVNEILSATPGILQLATAGQIDLSTAADIASNVLGGMRLEVDQLNRVNDVLAATASRSNTSIQQLGQALSFAAPFAAGAGVSIEEAAAAIGNMSDAGIQASRAGTGLVGVIRQLSNVTTAGSDVLEKYGLSVADVNIEARGLAPVLETLREANLNTADAIALFGSEAGAAAQVLVNDYSGAITNASGEAERMAGVIGSGLTASIKSFQSALSESVLQLGESGLTGGFKSVVDAASGVMSVYNDMLPEFVEANDLTEEQAQNLELMAAALKAVGAGAVAIAGVAAALRAATVAQLAFNAAARVNPYFLIASSVAAAAAAIYSFTGAQESAVAVWERAAESEAAYQAAIGDVGAANRVQEIAKERMELQERLNEAQGRWIRNGTEEAAIKSELAELEKEYHQITDARIEAEKAANDRRKEAREAEAEAIKLQTQLTQKQAEAEALSAAAERASTIDQVDLLRERLGLLKEGTVEFRKNAEIVRGAVDLGVITKDQASEIMGALVEAGEDAAEAFINPWQSTADSVAQSLQDAIASGDWDKLGDSIGNALAASISGVVNKTITDSLAKDLTANSSALAQIGGAFAGPIAGAVAGGAIQLAISELSDFFSLGDWDPTAARQAAQGTGTVLGSIDAKSESIANATDLAANASRELVGINRDMLRALETLQLGIGGASARVAQGRSGISLPGVSVNENFFSNFGVAGDVFTGYFDAIGSFLSFGLLDGLGSTIGKALGGKSRQVDEGVQIIGGYISDLVDETVVNAYATFRVKKNVFSSTKTKEQFQRIGGDVEQQFSLVFESLLDSVIAGSDALGVDAASALAGFRVSTQRLSLEGLSAEQQTAELEAYFGTVFDQLAGAAIPFLDDFQKAGEGLGETLARVATQVQVTQEAVNMLGLRFSYLSGAALIEASDRLIELNGGLDQFISSMQNFIGNFATESQQFQINANALASGLGDLPLPQTRDGFWQLVQAQDAATQAGAENIATLLRLQGTADQYYSAIEKAQEDYYQTEIQGQQQRLSEAQSANRAVQSAIDGMLYQSSAVQEASRQSALRTLDQIARAGRVDNLGQLQGALDAATQLDTGRFGSFADYAREYAKTAGVIGRVGDVTQQAESREARMLKSLESQLEAVKGLRKDLEISQLEIVKQTKKTARILERISLGENEALA